MLTTAENILNLAKRSGILRSRDLASAGIPRVALTRLHRAGRLQRVGRGLYTLPEFDVSEHHALALAAKRLPRAVVCLLSALRFHGLTTQDPFEVWIAIERTAHKPRDSYPPLRVVRFPKIALKEGVAVHRIDGVAVSITSAARTVADCFRYRNKIGLDVAIEALRDYLEHGSPSDLWEAAGIVRVQRVMQPYLRALS